MGKPLRAVLAIPDAHMPWTCKKSMDHIIDLAKQIKPYAIVNLGDLFDQLSFGRWPKSPNHITPKEEIEQARTMAEIFWYKLQKASPKSKCLQILGNHDIRCYKKVLSSNPEIEHLALESLRGLYSFKGVETCSDDRDHVVIDGVNYIHGFYSKLGDHCKAMQENVVAGHSHHGGVFYQKVGKRTIWELNAGMIAINNSPGMSYGPLRKLSKATLGCGLVTELGPQFIPFDF